MLRKILVTASAFAVAGVATAQATLLQIVTNGSAQQIEVQIGPVPGEVTVTGVNGGGSLSYFGVTSIDLRTGAAQDFVEFRIDTAVIPDIAINTAGGISDVKFIYEIPFTTDAVTSNVTVTGSTAVDAVDFLVLAAGDNFTGNWTVSQGAGNNTSTTTVNIPTPSTALALNYSGTAGTGQDFLGMTLVSGASDLSLSVGGNLGGGVDNASIYIDGLAPATTTAALNLDMGAGDDSATTEIISRGGTAAVSGSLRGGNNKDVLTLKIEGDGTLNTTLDGGALSDLLDVSVKGTMTGAPRLIAGAGDDELKIVVDGPLTLAPFLDGGLGYDKAIGFGTIINCEEIN